MNYLAASFIEDVYDTLQGVLTQDARIPDVEDLFVAGSPCDRAYAELWEAYQRLLSRLNKQNDDVDVEIIIDSLLTISKHLGTAMYQYGVKFTLESLSDSTETDVIT